MFLSCSLLYQKHLVTGEEQFFTNLKVCHFNLIFFADSELWKCLSALKLISWRFGARTSLLRENPLSTSACPWHNVRRNLSVTHNSSYSFWLSSSPLRNLSSLSGQNCMKQICCGDTSWLQRWASVLSRFSICLLTSLPLLFNQSVQQLLKHLHSTFRLWHHNSWIQIWKLSSKIVLKRTFFFNLGRQLWQALLHTISWIPKPATDWPFFPSGLCLE